MRVTLAGALGRCLSPARRDSIEATRAEADAAPSAAEAVRWRRTARTLLLRGLLAGPARDGLAVVLVIVGVGTLNASPSDVASQETLAGIVVGSGLVGYLWGRRAWLAAALVGGTVAAQHVLWVALKIPEPGIQLPAGWWGTVSLTVLILPALAGAYTGAGVRRLARGR